MKKIIISLLVITFPWMTYIQYNEANINISVSDIFFVAAFIYILFNIKDLLKETKTIHYISYFILLLLSLIFSYIAGFVVVNNGVGIASLALEAIKTIVSAGYFFIAYLMVRNIKEYEDTLFIYILGSIPPAIYGFVVLDSNLRFVATFKDPNLCAFYFITVFYISLLLAATQKSRIKRYISISCAILSTAIVLLTLSRGGILALIISLFLLFVLCFKDIKSKLLPLCLIAVILFMFFIFLDSNILESRTTKQTIARIENTLILGSDVDRIVLNEASYDIGINHFVLGIGKGNYGIYLRNYTQRFSEDIIPHNTLLSFFSQQGIIGLIIFLLLPIYIIYLMAIKKSIDSRYFLALIFAWAIASLTINIENIRFMWFFIGVMAASAKTPLFLSKVKSSKINKTVYITGCLALFISASILYTYNAKRIYTDFITYNGKTTQSSYTLENAGYYNLVFDVLTDRNTTSTVILSDDTGVIESIELKDANGQVSLDKWLEPSFKISLLSSPGGYIRLRNIRLISEDFIRTLDNYIFIPSFIQHKLKDDYFIKGFLPSLKTDYETGPNLFEPVRIDHVKVIRYSNLSQRIFFEAECMQEMENIYQLDLRYMFESISDHMPNEPQRNDISQRISLWPSTPDWIKGEKYVFSASRLMSSYNFKLLARYYDNTDKINVHDDFFVIPVEFVYEHQEIKPLGEANWININYAVNDEGYIRMSSNTWIETARHDLAPGTYTLSFDAYGLLFEDEHPLLRLRDYKLDELEILSIKEETNKYTVEFLITKPLYAKSFVLQHTNYKSAKGIGSRTAFVLSKYELVRK